MRGVAQRLGLALPCVTITVGGTNGKGSTCAMLESILLEAGYRVGTYTSPHLVDFAERARVNGRPADPALLAEQFEAVEAARGEVTLTYFEFSTLAILRLFQHAGLDAPGGLAAEEAAGQLAHRVGDEGRLGAEEPEEGDFVDAGLLRDGPGRGAAEARLGVESDGGFEALLTGRFGHWSS